MRLSTMALLCAVVCNDLQLLRILRNDPHLIVLVYKHAARIDSGDRFDLFPSGETRSSECVSHVCDHNRTIGSHSQVLGDADLATGQGHERIVCRRRDRFREY